MSKDQQFYLVKLMLHRYTEIGMNEGMNDYEIEHLMNADLLLLEWSEEYEECAVLRDCIKIWKELKSD